MHYYPKIYAPFKRMSSKSEYVDQTLWSKPEFEMLKNIDWVWTLKIDGTSIMLQWRGDKFTLDNVKGHTDKSQLNERTKKYFEETFCTPEAESVFESLYGEQNVNIYGEFCSKDMNQNYGHEEGIFYPFDVQNADNNKWWDRTAVAKFAEAFNLIEVPVMLKGNIDKVIKWVKVAKQSWNKDRSRIRYDTENGMFDVYNPLGDYDIEGLVGRLPYELLDGNGERIITKVKCKDFA